MPVGKSVDDYLAALAPRTRDVVDEIRRIVVNEFPSATEAISYDMPTFSFQGRRIVHVAGWNRHVSLYPVPKGDWQLLTDLGPYLAGRGTLKFDLAKPIPYDLIRRVVRAAPVDVAGDYRGPNESGDGRAGVPAGGHGLCWHFEGAVLREAESHGVDAAVADPT